MKKIHLLCNAHIDPVWLWGKEDGIAEAISTFRVAADFCENYGTFVFNHNESLLYEWVEEHEPALFERIGITARKQHIHIVIGLEQQQIAVLSGFHQLVGNTGVAGHEGIVGADLIALLLQQFH